MKRFLIFFLALLMALLPVCMAAGEVLVDGGYAMDEYAEVEYGEVYFSAEEVALYLHVFMELPVNYITKNEAKDGGWISSRGNLRDVADDACIGGDRFGNREGLLPDAKDRKWYECDVNYEGGYRGEERLLYSNDGLIYYSGDHYTTAELWYDGWYETEDGGLYGLIWEDMQ